VHVENFFKINVSDNWIIGSGSFYWAVCYRKLLMSSSSSSSAATTASSSSSSRATTAAISAPSSSASSPLSQTSSLSLSLSREVYAKIYLHAAKHFDCPVMGYLIGGRIVSSSGGSGPSVPSVSDQTVLLASGTDVGPVEDAPSVVLASPTCGGSRAIRSNSSRIFVSDMLPIGHSYPAGPMLQIAGEIVRPCLL